MFAQKGMSPPSTTTTTTTRRLSSFCLLTIPRAANSQSKVLLPTHLVNASTSIFLTGLGDAAVEFRRSYNDLAAAAAARSCSPTASTSSSSTMTVTTERAVRQKTDSSLPSEDAAEPSASGSREMQQQQQQSMRRTSSMPSIVESISGEQQQQQHEVQHQQLQQQQRQHWAGMSRKGGLPGRPIRHYNYEDKLTKLQKRALRFTWQRLLTRNGGKRIESVFEEVFDRMMRHMPVMREMFNTRTFILAMSRCDIATPRVHARLIVKMFEAAIKNLEVEERKRTDTASDFDPKLLGAVHASLRPYGFTSALWETFGEAVIDIVLNQEAVRDLPGASQAWVVLTACLVDQLRAGFESVRECPFKQQKREQQQQQLNGNGGVHCGGGGGTMEAVTGETGHINAVVATNWLNHPPIDNELFLHQPSLPQHARRKTITLADEECIATFGATHLGGDEQQQPGEPPLHPSSCLLKDRRCLSIMPISGGGGDLAGDEDTAARHQQLMVNDAAGTAANEPPMPPPHSRVQVKFLQDMASTEL